MKKFLAFFTFLPLFALEIVVNTSNNDYSVLTIKNNNNFMCKQKDKNTYICRFTNLPSTPVFATKSVDFSLKPFFDKNIFYMKIKVKNNEKQSHIQSASSSGKRP